MEIIKELHKIEHVGNRLSYKKIQEKHNINRGIWTYYVDKYNLKYDGRKFRCDDSYFNLIDTSNKAYILGFLYADGCITSDGRIAILLHSKDIEVLNFIKSEMRIENKIYLKDYNPEDRHEQCSLRFRSENNYKNLEKLGFCTNKTSTDSDILSKIPTQYKLDFIRGYFDGDGNVRCSKYKDYNGYRIETSISNGSKQILLDIQTYFSSIGINGGNLKRYTNKSDYYILGYGKKKDVLKIFNVLYNTVKYALTRKKCNALTAIEYYSNTEVTKEVKMSLEP